MKTTTFRLESIGPEDFIELEGAGMKVCVQWKDLRKIIHEFYEETGHDVFVHLDITPLTISNAGFTPPFEKYSTSYPYCESENRALDKQSKDRAQLNQRPATPPLRQENRRTPEPESTSKYRIVEHIGYFTVQVKVTQRIAIPFLDIFYWMLKKNWPSKTYWIGLQVNGEHAFCGIGEERFETKLAALNFIDRLEYKPKYHYVKEY